MKLVDELVQKIESYGIRVPNALRHPIHVGWTLWQDLLRCDLMMQASAMAYVTLLSLIPSLVAVFCVLSLFSPLVNKGTNLIDEIRGFVLTHLASGSGESVVGYLDKMLGNLDLAQIGWSSFAGVLITLILLLRQIEEALNRIWLIRKGRNIFTRFMYFWTFLTLGIVVLAIVLGASSGFDLRRLLIFGENADSGGIPGWIMTFAGGFLFFFFLYKIVPNCYVETRNAAIGGALASFLLQQAGRGYGMYVKNASNYQTLYGALAQLPLFLTWLYICWIIILLGALISWRMQEGFPKETEETLDTAASPLEQFRNIQLKAVMPLIALVAIYKNFQSGTGRGLSGQDLAHALKVPLDWIGEALEALGTLGYVIASKTEFDVSDGPSVTDPYYPAYPANSLKMERLHADLAKPVEEWLSSWQHELPLDIGATLKLLSSQKVKERPDLTVAQALELVG